MPVELPAGMIEKVEVEAEKFHEDYLRVKFNERQPLTPLSF